MLDKNFPIFDSVEIIDTSNLIMSIAKIELGVVVAAIQLDQLPYWVIKGMPLIFRLIEVFHKGLP